MQHAYLTVKLIDKALKHHQITMKEAKKLKKKIESQKSIYKLAKR